MVVVGKSAAVFEGEKTIFRGSLLLLLRHKAGGQVRSSAVLTHLVNIDIGT
jgi:hypothetical protein